MTKKVKQNQQNNKNQEKGKTHTKQHRSQYIFHKEITNSLTANVLRKKWIQPSNFIIPFTKCLLHIIY